MRGGIHALPSFVLPVCLQNRAELTVPVGTESTMCGDGGAVQLQLYTCEKT